MHILHLAFFPISLSICLIATYVWKMLIVIHVTKRNFVFVPKKMGLLQYAKIKGTDHPLYGSFRPSLFALSHHAEESVILIRILADTWRNAPSKHATSVQRLLSVVQTSMTFERR